MKNILHWGSRFFVIASVLFSVQACAQTTPEEEEILLQKAISLNVEACEIYPAIRNLDVCVDKVARKILADRDVKPERIDEILRDQAAAYSAKFPKNNFTDKFRSKNVLQQRGLITKLISTIHTGCAIPPAITDFELCMDKAFHSILSSRDPHSGYMNLEESQESRKQTSGELQGIGVATMFTNDKAVGVVQVMEGSPAERAGMQGGDRIVAIIIGTERLLSSPFDSLDAALKKIKGKPNTAVTLEILRGESDQLLTMTIVRGSINVPMVKHEVLFSPSGTKYGFVKLVQFGTDLSKKMVSAVTQIQKEHPDIKGIIFDLRGNPGGLLYEVEEAVNVLVDSPAHISLRTNSGIHPLGDTPVRPADITKGIFLGVFVDRSSASASEIFAGSLKKLNRSVTIGQRTWSKGTTQTIKHNGDGTFRKLTESEYLIGSPTDWVAVQCVGVTPDIDYEAEEAIKPKKEMHECDFEGFVVSGGTSSHPNKVEALLEVRDPSRYAIGLEMRDAVKVFDNREFAKMQRVKKLLKIEDKPQGESEKE